MGLQRSDGYVEELKRDIESITASADDIRKQRQLLSPLEDSELVCMTCVSKFLALLQMKVYDECIISLEIHKAQIEICVLNIRVCQERTRSALQTLACCPRNAPRG